MKMLKYESKVQEDFKIINLWAAGGGQAQLTEDGRRKGPEEEKSVTAGL